MAPVASIQDSVRNALDLAERRRFRSVALPVIGAGSGGFDKERAAALTGDVVARGSWQVRATLVRFRPK